MSFSSSEEDGFRTDESGRRIRIRPRGGPNKVDEDDEDDWGGPPPPPATRRSNNNNNNRNNNKARQQRDQWDDDWGVVPSSSSRTQQGTSNTNNFGGWDDFDIVESIDSDSGGGTRAPTRRRRENSSRSGDRSDRDRSGRRFVDSRRGGGDRQSSNNNNKSNDWGRNNRRETSSTSTTSRIPRQRSRPYSFQRSSSQQEEDPMKQKQQQQYRSINMNGLEASGFVHLYGLASILSALQSERRDLITSEEKSELISFDDDEYGASSSPPPPPQAQFRPYLFLQEKSATASQRKGSKAEQEQKILKLAEQRGVPIVHVDKGILNTLCGNRPHQGMVLRCGKLYFESMSRIPLPDETDNSSSSSTSPSDLWLVLDEVVDPQNLGALIRSAYFLGHKSKLNVLVCSKNSAPPSPVVSAASAGALELLPLYSTNNLPRTLQHAAEDGFRIIGASSSVPLSSTTTTTTTREQGHHAAPPPQVYDLQDLTPRSADNRPILLVLGSEGHGLRTLVAKACTEFVRIPSGAEANEEEDDGGGVDSLNVSVTGGIILWHLLRGQ